MHTPSLLINKVFIYFRVIKLLSNSRNEVTLKLAKRAAEHYGLMTLPDSSPFTERKGQSVVPQSYGKFVYFTIMQ